jgi:hypothetical protein
MLRIEFQVLMPGSAQASGHIMGPVVICFFDAAQ